MGKDAIIGMTTMFDEHDLDDLSASAWVAQSWAEFKRLLSPPKADEDRSWEAFGLDGNPVPGEFVDSGALSTRALHILMDPRLANLDWIWNLPQLRALWILGCKNLRRIDGLSQLKRPLRLEISQCHALRNIRHLPDIHSLHITQCYGLRRIGSLGERSKRLVLINCPEFTDIEALRESRHLEAIVLSDCPMVERFDALSAQSGLGFLALDGNPNIETLDIVARNVGLEQLYLARCTGLRDIAAIAAMDQLHYVDLRRCTLLPARWRHRYQGQKACDALRAEVNAAG